MLFAEAVALVSLVVEVLLKYTKVGVMASLLKNLRGLAQA